MFPAIDRRLLFTVLCFLKVFRFQILISKQLFVVNVIIWAFAAFWKLLFTKRFVISDYTSFPIRTNKNLALEHMLYFFKIDSSV